MKKIALVGATLALAMVAGSASAANSLAAGEMALNIGATVNTNQGVLYPREDLRISGKYNFTKDMAVLAGFGMNIMGGDAKGTDVGLMVGARKYLKTAEDLAPFIGGRFEYQTINDSNVTSIRVMGEAGAEYFLGKQFSLEGRVGLGYASIESKAPNKAKATALGSTTFGLSANFYF